MSVTEDDRWGTLLGGYRRPYDPRPALARLRTGDSDAAWKELWNELHHQGDVDTASYAAVPELVASYEVGAVLDWNVYALVGAIELERGRGKNPDLPSWLASRYHDALARLAERAHADLRRTDDPLVTRSALGVIAVAKDLRDHGRILLELDESEVAEFVAGHWGPSRRPQ